MKKIMMTVAMAAAVFTSCSNSEIVDLAPGKAIGFETYVGKASTKGEPVSGTGFADGATMRVWGFISDTQMATDFGSAATLTNLDGVTVTRNGGVWTYTPSAYWKENKAHSFFACAPSVADAEGVTFTGGQFTYTVQDEVDSQIDFMVADPLKNAAWDGTASPQAQTFKFHHALSQIKYAVRISTAAEGSKATDIKVTQITIQNLGVNNSDISTLATTGVINAVGKTADAVITYQGDPTGTCNGYTVTPATPVNPPVSVQGETATYANVFHNASDVLMLMPQTTSGKVKFTVKLTYTDENSVSQTADAFFITTAVQTWEPNKIYSYKFNIDMPKVMSQKPIAFGDPSIVDWSTDEGGADLNYTAP